MSLIDVLGTAVKHNADVTKVHFWPVLSVSLHKFHANIEGKCFPLNVYVNIYTFTYSQYWKNHDIEKHFKKYAQKWRFGNVNLFTSIRNIFRKALRRSSKCYKYKEL